jgi:hypothetical protein
MSRSEILYILRKYILLGVKKANIGSQNPKTEFEAYNQYGCVTYPQIINFTWSKKNILLGVKKAKIRLHPKTELTPQNIKNNFPLFGVY